MNDRYSAKAEVSGGSRECLASAHNSGPRRDADPGNISENSVHKKLLLPTFHHFPTKADIILVRLICEEHLR